MGLRLVTIRAKNQIERGCKICDEPFTKSEYAFATTRSTGGNATTNLYHIHCARKINLTVAEIWWNRLAKYKRKTELIDMNLDAVDIEENYELSYRRLPDEIKIQVDVRYYQK